MSKGKYKHWKLSNRWWHRRGPTPSVPPIHRIRCSFIAFSLFWHF